MFSASPPQYAIRSLSYSLILRLCNQLPRQFRLDAALTCLRIPWYRYANRMPFQRDYCIHHCSLHSSTTRTSLRHIYIVTCRPVAGQRLGKHIPATTNTQKQSDNFRFYATRCKYNNRGRGVFYVVRIYPLLGNGFVFYGSASRLYK
jgi:hypothetical protein